MKIIAVLLLLGMVAMGVFFSISSYAQAFDPGAASGAGVGSIDESGLTVGVGTTGGATSVTADTLVATLMRLVNWFAWFIGLASVVIGLYAGFLFITARGEAAQLKTARQTLLWAVIGIAIAMVAFSIVTLTKTFLNL